MRFKLFIAMMTMAGLFQSLQAQVTISGQNVTVNTITTSVPFLRIVPDARSGGLGDVGLATSPDMNAVWQNPARLAFIEGNYGVGITYTPWLKALVNDIHLITLTGYYKIREKQSIALGLRYFSLGKITFRDGNGQLIREGNPYEMAVDLHYSRQLGKYFSAAASGRFIYSNLATGIIAEGETTPITPGIAGSGDISFFLGYPIKVGNMNTKFNAGLAFTNIGSKISYSNSAIKDFIPANMGIGVGYEMDLNEHNEVNIYCDVNKLLVPTPDTTDANSNGILDFREKSSIGGVFSSFADAPNGTKEEFQELMVGAGLEYWYSKRFAARVGYFYEAPSKGDRSFVTLGLGVKYSIFNFDFSYLVPTRSQRHPLDNTLRFTLSFDFANLDNDPLFKKKDTAPAE